MIIAIDFDGTCVTHEFPKIGKDIGAAPILKALTDNGHKLILYTMRDDSYKKFNDFEGNTLQDAIEWFRSHEIPLYGVNKNESQDRWTHSPKVYAHLYIDDAALGVPLMYNEDRPYVDWKRVIIMLADKGCLLSEDVSRLIKRVMDAQEKLTIEE